MHSNASEPMRGHRVGKRSVAIRRRDRTAPQQERSRATRDRILGSLARLLASKTFDQISVAEVTAAARCSMSSFYARFPSKAALLSAFFDRFFAFSTGEVRAALSRIGASDAAAGNRARRLVEFLLRSYRDHRGLLRSLILYDRAHADSGFGSRTRAHKQQVSKDILRLMLGENAPAAKPHTIASASFGLWLVVRAIEQIALFDDPILAQAQISERQLVEELTSVLIRTLEPLSDE